MATIVAEALISISVEALLEKIVSGEFVNFFRRTKLDFSLLQKLEITLVSLQAILNDAEEKQIKNPAVKKWLEMLQDAVFEADNLFDQIHTEELKCKVEAEYENQTATAQVLKNISYRFKRFNRKINFKLYKLFESLEHLRKQKLGLKEGVSCHVWHGTPTGSVLVDESAIYGRHNDKKKLKEFLLSKDGSDGGSKIGVVSIVGMGGLGKTTVAKLLYNDPEVKNNFDLRGWAYISKDFDVVRVTKTILESVDSEATKTNDLNTVQVQLQQSLSNKTFLLVLDDVWYGGYVGWNSLNDIFNVGEMGSKIIITTRDERVALPMQTFFYVHHLKPLGSEDCWSLLAKHACVESNYQQRSNLEGIGREIADKCDGLPLAATALGALLRINLSMDYWNDVLKSSIWELTDDEVQPALLLSYRYLSTPLKRCFAYCSLFPKNSIIEKKMVVQLWIAEGLVHLPKSEKSWEKVGDEYFDELVLRSLIRRRSVDNEESGFEMHDLINDLATTISSPHCIRLDCDEQKSLENFERAHHLSYIKGEYDTYNKFDKLYGLKDLRTILALPLQKQWSDSLLSNKVIHNLFSTMKQVRVLSLSNYRSITKLPNSVENLIYLRYLNLSFTGIERLPPETCKLYNLQTLLLAHCWNLAELPEEMGKLVNLRHLDISGTSLTVMPIQIATLENLQTLSDFVVSKHHDGLKVAEIGKFPCLQGKLSISQLQNVTDPSNAFQANLKTKDQIDKLVLKWSSTTALDSQIQSLVLEQLQPSTNLKNLAIEGYAGHKFPNWLGYSLFVNMVFLKILNCDNCSWLPPLGQIGNLKELFIGEMKSLKSVGTEFYGRSNSPCFQPFPSLENLDFDTMPEWEEWKLIGGTATEFPRLTRLSLRHCPKLKGNLPLGRLGKLKELVIQGMQSVKSIGTEFYGSNISPTFQPFPSLETLCFEDMREWEEWKLVRGTVIEFPRLTHLSLQDCPKLKGNIPSKLPSLTHLSLEKCLQLKGNIPLPKTLQSLGIYECKNLEFLPRESLHNYTSLENLTIFSSCDSMTSFTLGSLPVLKSLDIYGCINLKSIPIAEDASPQSLSVLRSITIWECHGLESFSPGGLPTPKLIHFMVRGCEKLRSLPEPMNTLVALQELEIKFLPNLQCFAKDGFPVSLRQLSIGHLGGISQMGSWERLNCLSVLRIAGDDFVNAVMKMEVPLLPASIVSLFISNLDNIKCLDGKWLQHLTSLQNLEFSFFDKLKSLPEEGLPSISVLRIMHCPLLEASLQRKRGKEWRKIAHIPFVIINDEVIT